MSTILHGKVTELTKENKYLYEKINSLSSNWRGTYDTLCRRIDSLESLVAIILEHGDEIPDEVRAAAENAAEWMTD